MKYDMKIEIFNGATRHFDSDRELMMTEVQVIVIGDDDHDFEPVFILSHSDEMATKFAADAIDYIFEDGVTGVEITIVDKDCHAIRFSL